MKRILLTTTLLALIQSAAQADECMEKAEDQATMTQCAGQAYQASDAELNKVYRQIEQRLGDDHDARELLVESERAWIAFRDAECAFASSAVVGGSAYPMIQAMCLDGLTQNRVEDLSQYLDCEEGDLSCPVPPAD